MNYSLSLLKITKYNELTLDSPGARLQKLGDGEEDRPQPERMASWMENHQPSSTR